MKIVITGAHSDLGRAVLNHLHDHTDATLVTVVSPRWQGGPLHASVGGRIHQLATDLTQDLGPDLARHLQSADRLIHFAWIRGPQFAAVNTQNLAMIDRLHGSLIDPSRLIFLSSVAAGPSARSIYGRAKYHAMQAVASAGGVSLACGLVMAREPAGPYRLLSRVVKTLPFALRFFGGGPTVYPVRIECVCRGIGQACEQDLPGGTYQLFGQSLPLNEFLALLERRYPRRRMPLWLSAGLILGTVGVLRGLRLAPSPLADKVMTFLHKDEEFLKGLSPVPGLKFGSVKSRILEPKQ